MAIRSASRANMSRIGETTRRIPTRSRLSEKIRCRLSSFGSLITDLLDLIDVVVDPGQHRKNVGVTVSRILQTRSAPAASRVSRVPVAEVLQRRELAAGGW